MFCSAALLLRRSTPWRRVPAAATAAPQRRCSAVCPHQNFTRVGPFGAIAKAPRRHIMPTLKPCPNSLAGPDAWGPAGSSN